MDLGIRSKEAVVPVESDESHFWNSFKQAGSAWEIAVSPRDAKFERTGEFNIECGITVVSVGVAGKPGELVSVYKRAGTDDAAYLVEAGFKQNRALEAPAVEARRLTRG